MHCTKGLMTERSTTDDWTLTTVIMVATHTEGMDCSYKVIHLYKLQQSKSLGSISLPGVLRQATDHSRQASPEGSDSHVMRQPSCVTGVLDLQLWLVKGFLYLGQPSCPDWKEVLEPEQLINY